MSYALLLIGFALFVGGHFALSHPPIRSRLVARLKEGPFMGLYSAVAGVALFVFAVGYSQAGYIALWDGGAAARWAAFALSGVGLAAVGMALRPDNPTLNGSRAEPKRWTPTGVFTITRHPMMWGVALWAIGHLAANGDLASLIFFSGFLLLALGGAAHSDARRSRADAVGFAALAMKSSYWPFAALTDGRARFAMTAADWRGCAIGAAIAIAAFAAHAYLFGVSPSPW